MDIVNLERQHKEVYTLVEEIRSYDKTSAAEHAPAIAKSLAQLSGIIKMHLLSEDKFLYPALKQHADEKVRTTAVAFDEEMQALAKAFEAYKAKYIIASKIIQNTEEFLKETKAVFATLEKRMRKEDQELYPLLKTLA